jgi:hypothetical protein
MARDYLWNLNESAERREVQPNIPLCQSTLDLRRPRPFEWGLYASTVLSLNAEAVANEQYTWAAATHRVPRQ